MTSLRTPSSTFPLSLSLSALDSSFFKRRRSACARGFHHSLALLLLFAQQASPAHCQLMLLLSNAAGSSTLELLYRLGILADRGLPVRRRFELPFLCISRAAEDARVGCGAERQVVCEGLRGHVSISAKRDGPNRWRNPKCLQQQAPKVEAVLGVRVGLARSKLVELQHVEKRAEAHDVFMSSVVLKEMRS
eukprot:scaffold529_cov308-Pinguiococcus_pyrenoidosus.AAC.26